MEGVLSNQNMNVCTRCGKHEETFDENDNENEVNCTCAAFNLAKHNIHAYTIP